MPIDLFVKSMLGDSEMFKLPTRPIIRFRNTLLEFFDTLMEFIPSDLNLEMIQFAVKESIPIMTIVKNVKRNLSEEDGKRKGLLEGHALSFFLQNDLFGIEPFCPGSGDFLEKVMRVTEVEDQDKLWLWMEKLVRLAELC